MNFHIRMADRHVLIHSVYSDVYRRCEPYLTHETDVPDIELRINWSMLRIAADQISEPGTQRLDLSSVELLVVQQLLTEELLSFDTLLMHGAVIAVDDAAYMFTAASGTGKTTHIQKWLENIDGAYVVNGDKPFVIVGQSGEESLACGSPWAGKEHLQTNVVVPLKAIALLERADENRMERISSAQAFPFVYQQVHQPDDEEKLRNTLQLVSRLVSSVPVWRFRCNNFRDDCFEVAYNALVKGQA